jgi:hypothetical protein
MRRSLLLEPNYQGVTAHAFEASHKNPLPSPDTLMLIAPIFFIPKARSSFLFRKKTSPHISGKHFSQCWGSGVEPGPLGYESSGNAELSRLLLVPLTKKGYKKR